MKKNTTTLKIKKKTHDELMALTPKVHGHTWVLLGANRLGTIVDYASIVTYDVCNTPGIEAKAMTKAMIALIKKKRSPAGFYIIPGQSQHRRSGGAEIGRDIDANTSAEVWYSKNYYALGMMQGKQVIYVKRSLADPVPTAILSIMGRKVQSLVVEIVAPKPRVKKVKQLTEQPAEQPVTQVV